MEQRCEEEAGKPSSDSEMRDDDMARRANQVDDGRRQASLSIAMVESPCWCELRGAVEEQSCAYSGPSAYIARLLEGKTE